MMGGDSGHGCRQMTAKWSVGTDREGLEEEVGSDEPGQVRARAGQGSGGSGMREAWLADWLTGWLALLAWVRGLAGWLTGRGGEGLGALL